MIEHYLPNKNERATIAQISKFAQLNIRSETPPVLLSGRLTLNALSLSGSYGSMYFGVFGYMDGTWISIDIGHI